MEAVDRCDSEEECIIGQESQSAIQPAAGSPRGTRRLMGNFSGLTREIAPLPDQSSSSKEVLSGLAVEESTVESESALLDSRPEQGTVSASTSKSSSSSMAIPLQDHNDPRMSLCPS